MLDIGTDGKCYPCIRYMKYTLNYQKEQPIGDIYVGLDKKEDNEWLNKLNQVTMSSQSPQKCLDCKISSGCSLCTAYNYDKHGDPNIRSTYICDTHKARVLANGYFYNKLRKIIPSVQPFEINLEKDLALTIIDSEEYEKLIVLSEWRV